MRAIGRSAVSAAARAITPAKPVLKNAAQIPLTLAGLGCVDAAFYRWALIPGLLATGITLILVEHMLSTEA